MQENDPVTFPDKKAILSQLKRVFETSERIYFYGCYDLPADPLTSERDLVTMTAHEVWQVTGYHFR